MGARACALRSVLVGDHRPRPGQRANAPSSSGVPRLRREREYQSRYRELADHGEFRRVSEVLDENWIKNCLRLTG